MESVAVMGSGTAITLSRTVASATSTAAAEEPSTILTRMKNAQGYAARNTKSYALGRDSPLEITLPLTISVQILGEANSNFVSVSDNCQHMQM